LCLLDLGLRIKSVIMVSGLFFIVVCADIVLFVRYHTWDLSLFFVIILMI